MAEKNSAQTNRQTHKQTLRKWWSFGREPIIRTVVCCDMYNTCAHIWAVLKDECCFFRWSFCAFV